LVGARGALSNYLQVPENLETAITAALGEFLDAVLIDTGPDQALDLLDKKSGRGVLLPLLEINPADKITTRGDLGSDVLGVAADLIDAPEELRPVVDALLGNTYIVRNRSAARGLLAHQQPGLRAVTLQGNLFHASGAVQSVGAGDAGEGALLGRIRKKRDLLTEYEGVNQELAMLQNSLDKVEGDIKAAQAGTTRLASKYQEKRKQYEQVDAEYKKARLEFERVKQQWDWQKEKRASFQADLLNSQAEEEKILADLTQIETQLTESRTKIQSFTRRMADVPLDEYQSQVAHWDTMVAVASQALEDASARQEDRRGAFERSQHAQNALRKRLDELGRTRETTSNEQRQDLEEETRIGVKIKALQAQIEPAEGELKELETERSKQRESESASRHRLRQAEQLHAQTRITFARRQETLQTLKRRIEDDFGLVAYEYDEQISGPTPLPLGGLVEQLAVVSEISEELEETIKRQRAQLRRMGAINPEAQQEFKEVKERFEFLTEQVEDLNKAEIDVRKVIGELDELMQREFKKTFDAVATEFRKIFTTLFGGGSARLVLTDGEDLTNTGIDIEARLPGRRTQGLSLLSGGERSLTASALVFALLAVSPTPFCVLDEVDAMLDESNVGRFREKLRELSENTQFVIVTHNRSTVQVADVIYGVTMGRDSVSQVLSLKLDEVSKVVK